MFLKYHKKRLSKRAAFFYVMFLYHSFLYHFFSYHFFDDPQAVRVLIVLWVKYTSVV